MRALRIALVGASLTATTSAVFANGWVVVVNINFPPTKWEAEADVPYAIWDARSSAVAGTEVALSDRGGKVDIAELVPQAVYATDQDLIDGQKVWLPKGGLLIKMAGGGGNWYCTWRYGAQAAATAAAFAEADQELCVEADASGRTTNAKLFPASLPAVMTLTHGFSEKRLKQGNTVSLRLTDRTALPPRTELQVVAAWHARNGGEVCLEQVVIPLKLGGTCFSDVGQSVTLAGGRYTLTSLGADH